MPEFDELAQASMHEAAHVLKAFPGDTDDEVAIDKGEYDYAKRETNVLDRNARLNVVESRVALMGFPALAEGIDSFRAEAIGMSKLEKATSAAVLTKVNELNDLRCEIITGFAEAYRAA